MYQVDKYSTESGLNSATTRLLSNISEQLNTLIELLQSSEATKIDNAESDSEMGTDSNPKYTCNRCLKGFDTPQKKATHMRFCKGVI